MSKLQERKNKNKRECLHPIRKRLCFNDFINRNNSRQHELTKILTAFDYVYDEGCEVFVEAQLIDGGIADLFISDIPFIVEIRGSEKDKQTNKKRVRYPCRIETIDIGGKE